MAARRRLAAVPEQPPPVEAAPDLRDAVRAALGQMTWLTPADEAMKALALRLASEIEQAVDRAELAASVAADAKGDLTVYRRLEKLAAMCDVTKAVGWLGPQLQGVLRDLGGAPGARKALTKDRQVGGRLAQLRAAAGQHDS